jgi:hypothetical protein
LAKNTSKEAMSKIKIITAPDKVFDQALSITVVCPGEALKASLQNYLTSTDLDINIYLHDTENIEWLLTVARMSNYILIDIDNCDIYTSHFLGYLLTLPNTYYKCEHMKVKWDLLNKNRFYDFPNINEEI